MYKGARSKLAVIKICKKVKLIDDKSDKPTIYHFVYNYLTRDTIKVQSLIGKNVKSLYLEEMDLELADVEPVVSDRDLQEVELMFYGTKRLIPRLINYVTDECFKVAGKKKSKLTKVEKFKKKLQKKFLKINPSLIKNSNNE